MTPWQLHLMEGKKWFRGICISFHQPMSLFYLVFWPICHKRLRLFKLCQSVRSFKLMSFFVAFRPFEPWTSLPQLRPANGPVPIWESAPVQPSLLPHLRPSARAPCYQPPVPQQPGGHDPHQPTAAERSLPASDQRPEEHGRFPGTGILSVRPQGPHRWSHTCLGGLFENSLR